VITDEIIVESMYLKTSFDKHRLKRARSLRFKILIRRLLRISPM